MTTKIALGANMTSIYGRRLGLSNLSTSMSGATKGPLEFLQGMDGIRKPMSTAETTDVAMNPSGVSVIVGTSAASTPVFTLAPPIPGVRKEIVFGSTDSALYVKMSSGVTIAGTSLGNTGCAAIRSSGGGAVELMGVTTALYWALNVSSTTVNTVGFAATT
jgi:hypothetical protein